MGAKLAEVLQCHLLQWRTRGLCFDSVCLQIALKTTRPHAPCLCSGTTTISFGTTVNKAACDCNDQACIAQNNAAVLGNSGPKISFNPAALPNGEQLLQLIGCNRSGTRLL